MLFLLYLKILAFVFPPFSPFVCQTRPDMETTKIPAWPMERSICLLTEGKRQWAMLVLGWVTVSVWDQLWDVSKLEFLCHKTFLNSSALLMSLMALCSHQGTKTPFGLVFCLKLDLYTGVSYFSEIKCNHPLLLINR